MKIRRLAVLSALCIFFCSATAQASEALPGVGALGRIEPRSRVVKISHDAGPEGARVEKLNVREGDAVAAGDVLAVFSSYSLKEARLSALQAQNAVIEARRKVEEANNIYAKQELARVTSLSGNGTVSVSRQQETARNAAQSDAQLQSLQAELNALKMNIRVAEEELLQAKVVTPVGGTVIKIRTWPGERVSDKGIAEIADLSKMDVVAQVYERDMPRVSVGQKAEMRVPGFAEPFTGEVRELGYQVMKNDMNETDPLADKDNRVIEVRIGLSPEASAKLSHLIFMQVDVRIY